MIPHAADSSTILDAIRAYGPVYQLTKWIETLGPNAKYGWLILPFLLGVLASAIAWLIATSAGKRTSGSSKSVWVWILTFVFSSIVWCFLRSGNGFLDLFQIPISHAASEIFLDAIRVGFEFSGGFMLLSFRLWKRAQQGSSHGLRLDDGHPHPALGTLLHQLDTVSTKYKDKIRSLDLRNEAALKKELNDFSSRLGSIVANFSRDLGVSQTDLPPITIWYRDGSTKSLPVEEVTGGAVAAAGGFVALLWPVTTTSGWWIFATTTTVPLIALAPPAAIAVGIGLLILGGAGLASMIKARNEHKQLQTLLIETANARVEDIKRWAIACELKHRMGKPQSTRHRPFVFWIALSIVLSAVFALVIGKLAVPGPTELAERWLKQNFGSDAAIIRTESTTKTPDGGVRIICEVRYHNKGGSLTQQDWRFRIDRAGEVAGVPIKPGDKP